MKVTHLRTAMLIFAISFSSCVNQTQQSHITSNSDTISNVKEDIKIDKEKVVSLIKEDEERRGIWSYEFKQSASFPLFYEAICDDGLYLYRATLQNQRTYVVMLEDANICSVVDFIVGNTDTTGVEYKHNGNYEIVNDSIVNISFDKLYRNWSYTNDTETFEPIYHIKCTHRYKLSGLTWKKIKADTTIIVDEREKALCDDIWKYTR